MVWLERDGHRVLGGVEFQPGRCVLEVLSESRAKKGRKLLEKLLGSLIKHRSTVVEDALQAVERAAPRKPPRPELISEEAKAAAEEFLTRYYRSWLDESIPALGGRTPRHAAKLKTQRPILVSLLKMIERGAAEQAAAGQPTIDVSFLWTELGLTRE
jgi:hypothetical protein